MKCDTRTNSNMLNSMVMFICPAVKVKYCFYENLFQKIENCLFKVKFCTWIDLNMLNLMLMFKFSRLN